MSKLHHHYQQILGLEEPWKVSRVELQLKGKRVEIELEHGKGNKVECPDCGASCPIADHGLQRQWRHLDTMQFETILMARTPRSDCQKCGVKTIAVPWAAKHSRFTLMFEAFAIEVIECASSLKQAADFLNLNWAAVDRIMERAVERGLERREAGEIDYVGIDEKSFGRGHDYVSLMTDLEESRVIEVVEGRKKKDADRLWKALTKQQRENIKGVAMDMWPAYMGSAREQAPGAEIVHDRYHISSYLNKAVDKVRKQENRQCRREGDERLVGTKYQWLINPERMEEEQWKGFAELKESDLKTARAWAIKENFRWFWEYAYRGCAHRFFNQWYGWARRSKLEPIKSVANTLKNHLDGLLSYFVHPITNAVSEGLNSRIQSIKSAARGFRSFSKYRIRILFFCGKLSLYPDITH